MLKLKMPPLKILGVVGLIAMLGACESTTETANAGAGNTTVTGPRPGSQEDLIATAGSDRVFFDTDRSTIRADQRATLERQVAWMARNPSVTVQVQGHADERGTREYNLALGQRRANAARDVLVAGGVAGARVSTISFGKDQPAALGSSEDAWAQNRRAVTMVR